MISICLKTLEKNTLDNLEKYFDDSNFPNIYYTQKKFKNFYNFIIHYKGSDEKNFYSAYSEILSNFIISNYEENILNTSLKLDFFYFSTKERMDILKKVSKYLRSKKIYNEKKSILTATIIDYTKTANKYNIDGFVNFRIYEYRAFLQSKLEQEVHNYVIQQEYLEYVNLLKEYISVKEPQTNLIHLIYSDDEKILLDDTGNIITTTAQKKYLSDISFSSNDFILNSIISLMPNNIVIHLYGEEDNFIQFLKIIFENRHTICKEPKRKEK